MNMESQVCVHCLNKKIINSTNNRLVTESCGHVKCIDCLLHESAGCAACAEKISAREPADTPEPSEGQDAQTEYCFDKNDKKKKLETSHIRIETDGSKRYYFCTACKRKFQARSQVSYHAYCNGQQKPYHCTDCNKSFASHSHFQYHMRVHRGERTYACDTCGDSFFQMSKLQRHKLKHTKEKKHRCGACSAAFTSAASLRKHALTHSGERPYGCEQCGRRFRDSSNYRKHQAKHNGGGCARSCLCGACGRRRARAHVCPRCPQAFSARRDMRRHAAVHSDVKPFRCRVCSRRFRRKDNLERHLRNTHPAEPAPAPADQVSPARLDPSHEKSRLASLNPLPPLPPDLIQQHMQQGKANRRLPALLPPIDERKFSELVKLGLQVSPAHLDPGREKSRLASLNPLPPLPPDLIQQHMQQGKAEKPAEDKLAEKPQPKVEQAVSVEQKPSMEQKPAVEQKLVVEQKAAVEQKPAAEQKPVVEQQSVAEILAANHARRSVIFGPVRRAEPEPEPEPEPSEYVHKIRKANRRLPALLPPIDERKFSELVKLGLQNNLDVGAPPEKFRALYKKILYERSEKEAALVEEQHWKKKKLNINW